MAKLNIGIYLNSQNPETDDARARLEGLVKQVKLAESHGFDSIWAGEHHLTPGFHFFPQLPLLAHLAAYTGDMTLGTNLLLLPLHRPVEVAEQVALIDIATRGRFILAVGQGYRREEFAALGVPFEERLPRMVESIEVIRRLWTERNVDHESSSFSLKGATLRPSPYNPSGPPIWIGATTDRAIRRAAEIGDGFMATPNADNNEVSRQVQLFARSGPQRRVQGKPAVGRMLEVYCHEDADEARRRAAPHLLTKYASYAKWGLTGSAGEAARAAGTIEDQNDFTGLAEDRFVIGKPDDVVAGLLEQHRKVGVTHLAMRLAWPGSKQSDAMECIDLLGAEVLPRVRTELS
ncbi:LLM class flavin-dependent oxidoreductase [Ornithinimicrobium murale]|uniref:LLM class flavin-dependent oxidoreductase n=1 Tax=Ornithinimicrobium murale TaxID=1050153 RepID=UPI0013B3776D|nr:LLM class flavin-dependent oxidoreductase [Ornithinimicrobium murale]